MQRPKLDWRPTVWFCLSLVTGACFGSGFARGLPCENDAECGSHLRCMAGYCGGLGVSVDGCGNELLDVDEECDNGAENADDAVCTLDCKHNVCGDGKPLDTEMIAEECDDGDDNADDADCTSKCKINVCGDGEVFNTGMGAEECDDGADNGPGRACNATCLLNVCGDGDKSPSEGCDDGNTADGDACPADCRRYCDEDRDNDGWFKKCPNNIYPPGTQVPDCNDSNPRTFPGAAPQEDDPDACMTDQDYDGYGDKVFYNFDVQAGTDCDDMDPDTFPSAAPMDHPLACMTDKDGDDYGDRTPSNADVIFGTDCDDTNQTIFPGAAPNDSPDACMEDEDGDGYGDDTPTNPESAKGTDCDDNDTKTFPGAAPVDDPVACMKDTDDDHHGDAAPDNPQVTPGSDCNDDNYTINPSNSQLITAASMGEFYTLDEMFEVKPVEQMLDTTQYPEWNPTSVAIHPMELGVYASLLGVNHLVTMDYCGGGMPNPLFPQPYTNICGISFDRDGNLWGVDAAAGELLRFDPDGSVVDAKPLTYEDLPFGIEDCGMTWDCHENRLLLSETDSNAFYSVDTDNAVVLQIAQIDHEVGASLAYDPIKRTVLLSSADNLYAVASDGSGPVYEFGGIMYPEPFDDLEFIPRCK